MQNTLLIYQNRKRFFPNNRNSLDEDYNYEMTDTEWKAAEKKMLEEMLKFKMFASKVALRNDLPAGAAIIGAIWWYGEKMFTNRKKSRLCSNGKPLKPKKKIHHEPYTACIFYVWGKTTEYCNCCT